MSSTTPPPDFGLFTSLRYDPQLRDEPENTKLSHYDPNTPESEQNSPFYSLIFHYERLVKALDHFGWTKNVIGDESLNVPALASLNTYRQALESAVQEYQERTTDPAKDRQPLKLRPVVWHDGRLEIEITPTPPVPVDNLFLRGPIPTPGDLQPPILRPDYIVLIDSRSMTPSSYTSYKTTPRPHYDAARLRVGIKDETEAKEVMIWNPDGNVMEGSRTNVYLYREGKWVTPTDDSGCLRGTERRRLHEKGMVTFQDVKVDDVKDGEIVLLSNGLRGTWAATVRRFIPAVE